MLCTFFVSFIHVHSPWAGADNPLGPKFWCQQEDLITMVICCCKFKKNLLTSNLGDDLNSCGRDVYVNRNILLLQSFVASFKKIFEVWFYTIFFSWFNSSTHTGAGADSPKGTKFWCQQKDLITLPICCIIQRNLFEVWFYTFFFMI